MTTYYSPGQLSVVYPFLTKEPKWLLLGGPADANEAQTAVAKWPGIKVVGVDPNPKVIQFQTENGWPEGAPLIQACLYDKVCDVPMADAGSDLRHACAYVPNRTGTEDMPSGLPTYPSTTWDLLDAEHGPFEDAIMWMDIEGSELEALLGAKELFARKAILLVNVEMESRTDYKNVQAVQFLTDHGFKAVKDWNDSATCRDRIFVRQD